MQHANEKVTRTARFLHNLVVLCMGVLSFESDVCVLRWLEKVEDTCFNNYVDWLMMTYAFSLLDLPVLSLPCGMTDDGRPVGLQMVGKPRAEAALLAAAMLFEQKHACYKMVPVRQING